MSGTTTHVATGRRTRGARPDGVVLTWASWMREALRTIGTRRHLAQMDDRMLKDIGVTRAEALNEAERAPWDIGPHNRG